MRILIVGLPKSGTTILTYRVAAALDDVHVDFEPQNGPVEDGSHGHRHVVTKKLVGSQTADLAEYRHYDRKIWISRDPRDFLVSQSLYRWHREEPPDGSDRARFDEMLERLSHKEADPGSVTFRDLEPVDYFETLDAVADLWRRELGADWMLFRYEDMIDGSYGPLNAYLGFEVEAEAEVASGLERVVRRKGYGDWRDWFTPADVEYYRSGGLTDYMSTFGYRLDDWRLNDPQVIDPAHGSHYVANLFDDHSRPARSAESPPTDEDEAPASPGDRLQALRPSNGPGAESSGPRRLLRRLGGRRSTPASGR